MNLHLPHHTIPLYFTKNGVNNEPPRRMDIPITKVKIILLKGDRKFQKISAGTIVQRTKVNLPKMVILCSVPQLLHSIGLYVHIKDL